MTRDEARRELAENLMMLAEALLDDEACGEYVGNVEEGEFEITSSTGSGMTVIAVTNWSPEEIEEWAEYIE
jgi:hypothetical protein